MGQILRGSATTRSAIRAAIQRSKTPLKELAAQQSGEVVLSCPMAMLASVERPLLGVVATRGGLFDRLMGDVTLT